MENISECTWNIIIQLYGKIKPKKKKNNSSSHVIIVKSVLWTTGRVKEKKSFIPPNTVFHCKTFLSDDVKKLKQF